MGCGGDVQGADLAEKGCCEKSGDYPPYEEHAGNIVKLIRDKFDAGMFSTNSQELLEVDDRRAELKVIPSGCAKSSVVYFEERILGHARQQCGSAVYIASKSELEQYKDDHTTPRLQCATSPSIYEDRITSEESQLDEFKSSFPREYGQCIDPLQPQIDYCREISANDNLQPPEYVDSSLPCTQSPVLAVECCEEITAAHLASFADSEEIFKDSDRPSDICDTTLPPKCGDNDGPFYRVGSDLIRKAEIIEGEEESFISVPAPSEVQHDSCDTPAVEESGDLPSDGELAFPPSSNCPESHSAHKSETPSGKHILSPNDSLKILCEDEPHQREELNEIVDDSDPQFIQKTGNDQTQTPKSSNITCIADEEDHPKYIEIGSTYPVVAIVPLNGEFETFIIELDHTYRFGRSNYSLFPEKYYYTFPSQVISRNHLEIFALEDRVCIQDIGSSSGTFINGVRACAPYKASKVFEIREGDVIQMGKTWSTPSGTGAVIDPTEMAQRKCVRFGVAILKPNSMGRIDSSTLKMIVDGIIHKAKVEEQHCKEESKTTSPAFDPADMNIGKEEVRKESDADTPVMERAMDKSLKDEVSPSIHMFVVLASYLGEKVKKIILLNELGSEFVDVSLREWHVRRRIVVTAKPFVDSSLYSLQVIQSKIASNNPNILPYKFQTLSGSDGEIIATLEFISKIKLLVTPSKVLGNDNTTYFTIIGDFDAGKYVIIERSMLNRIQKYIGGSNLSKNTKSKFLESQKISQVSINGSSYFRIIFSAIMLLYCIRTS